VGLGHGWNVVGGCGDLGDGFHHGELPRDWLMNPRSYLGISPMQAVVEILWEDPFPGRSSNLGRGKNLGCLPKF
jgi:hypothetical protein